ncbi:MAG: DUF4825 domain-containing protein, partial [Oscillospiraceae bacterium]
IAAVCIAFALVKGGKVDRSEVVLIQGVPVQPLWENRTEYVGDNAAVGNILFALPYCDRVAYDHVEMKTDAEPYGITVHLTAKGVDLPADGTTGDKPYKKIFDTNAKIIFSLVGNLDEITFEVEDDKGKSLSNHFKREDYEAVFEKTKTLEGFKEVLSNFFTEGEELSSNQEQLTLDRAVSLALLSNKDYKGNECEAEGHIILGYDDSDKDKTKIYALATTGGYSFVNGNFEKVSGTGVTPVVVRIDKANQIQIERPLDGSDYTSSIKKMFPKEYHDEISEGYNRYDEIVEQEVAYAKEYLKKIGREGKIGEYADFEHISLTSAGVSVEVSNLLQNFYKEHFGYPDFIGNREYLQEGKRMAYQTDYDKDKGEIQFKKYSYEDKEPIEIFRVNSKTGDIASEEF